MTSIISPESNPIDRHLTDLRDINSGSARIRGHRCIDVGVLWECYLIMVGLDMANLIAINASFAPLILCHGTFSGIPPESIHKT